MKPHIKVNINRPPVPSEEIAARRDFDKMLKQLVSAQKPFYLKPWFLGAMAGLAVVIVASIVIATIKRHQQQQSPTAHISIRPADTVSAASQATVFFKDRVPAAEVRFAEYKVDAGQGGSFRYRSGSHISVPAMAFTDAQGKPVSGKVQLMYREFHNPAEIIASGVPMTYDSAGKMYHFQSAGMFEIHAYQDGKPLLVNQGKSIMVEMSGRKDKAHYSQYVLDTNAKNWIYKGAAITKNAEAKGTAVNEVLPVSQQPQVLAKVKDSIQKHFLKKLLSLPMLRKPQPPQKADGLRPHFNLDILPEDFPELADYKNLTFEIGPENKNFNPSSFKVDWEDVKLDTLPGANRYRLTLSKGTQKESYVVYPVFQAADYNKAVETYRKKYDEYVKKHDERLANEKIAKANAEKAYNDWLTEQKKKEAEAVKAAYQAMQNNSKVTYLLAVNRFGFYNCDCPLSLPRGRTVSATFQNAQGQALNPSYVYLVERGRNAVFTYYPYTYSHFSFDPGKSNTLITLGEGKIYVFHTEDFKQIPAGENDYTFHMDERDNAGSIGELAKFIDMPNAGGNDFVLQ